MSPKSEAEIAQLEVHIRPIRSRCRSRTISQISIQAMLPSTNSPGVDVYALTMPKHKGKRVPLPTRQSARRVDWLLTRPSDPVRLPQHPDQHRPECPVLLASLRSFARRRFVDPGNSCVRPHRIRPGAARSASLYRRSSGPWTPFTPSCRRSATQTRRPTR
jgi:hypothetical protein